MRLFQGGPVKIDINTNPKFFAKVDWFLYKTVTKTRKSPCGRCAGTSYLCCTQPIDAEHCYLIDGGREARCKCCGFVRILSSDRIVFTENGWETAPMF